MCSYLPILIQDLLRYTLYCDTWHLYYIAYSCYHFYRDLGKIIILLPDIWYSCTPELLYPWTLVSPVLMSHALFLLLIARSYRHLSEHAWCWDDEDVSHNRASVRQILNGTKCHTEQSATPYTWWGPPLESVTATYRIHFHTEQSAT